MIESAIKAIDGTGQNPQLPARPRQQAETAAREERDADNVQAVKKEVPPPPAPLEGSVFSTRVTLDAKTLQVYIQTVAEQPTERVVHSYPPPPEFNDPTRLIVLS